MEEKEMSGCCEQILRQESAGSTWLATQEAGG